MKHFKEVAYLQLFAESGAADGDGTGEAPAAEGTTGESTPAAAGQEDMDTEFDALVKKGGKYADAFQKRAQQNFNKRYAEFKSTQDKASRLEQFAKTVAQRYPGVNADDYDALEDAFFKDERFFGDKAAETGKSAKEIAESEYMQRKLSRYQEAEKAEKARKQTETETKKFYDGLLAQEKEMHGKYGDFDLDAELQNPAYKDMVKKGISLEDAYWAVHRNELAQKVVADTKAATVQSIASRGTRTTETAAASSVPSVSQVDYSKLSRRDFMKILNE